MAVISTYVSVTSSATNKVFFTAPFDCIIGVNFEYCASNGPYYCKSYNGTTAYQTLAQSVSSGTRISNIIMKAGDKLLTIANVGEFKVHITGVSA